MLSRKFLSDGETPEAASATSGTTMEAVSAAAVNPVIAFSFREALTLKLAADFEAAIAIALEGLTGSGLKKASQLGTDTLFWLEEVKGMAVEIEEAEAIS